MARAWGPFHLSHLRAPNDVPATENMEHAGQAQLREEQNPQSGIKTHHMSGEFPQ